MMFGLFDNLISSWLGLFGIKENILTQKVRDSRTVWDFICDEDETVMEPVRQHLRDNLDKYKNMTVFQAFKKTLSHCQNDITDGVKFFIHNMPK